VVRQSPDAVGHRSQDARQSRDARQERLERRFRLGQHSRSGWDAWGVVRRGTGRELREVRWAGAADSCRERPAAGDRRWDGRAECLRLPQPVAAGQPLEAAAEPCRQDEVRSAASPCGVPAVPVWARLRERGRACAAAAQQALPEYARARLLPLEQRVWVRAQPEALQQLALQ